MAFQLNDGTELPYPQKRLHACDQGVLVETLTENVLLIESFVVDDVYQNVYKNVYTADCLVALVQHRLSEGWILKSMDRNSASFGLDRNFIPWKMG